MWKGVSHEWDISSKNVGGQPHQWHPATMMRANPKNNETLEEWCLCVFLCQLCCVSPSNLSGCALRHASNPLPQLLPVWQQLLLASDFCKRNFQTEKSSIQSEPCTPMAINCSSISIVRFLVPLSTLLALVATTTTASHAPNKAFKVNPLQGTYNHPATCRCSRDATKLLSSASNSETHLAPTNQATTGIKAGFQKASDSEVHTVLTSLQFNQLSNKCQWPSKWLGCCHVAQGSQRKIPSSSTIQSQPHWNWKQQLACSRFCSFCWLIWTHTWPTFPPLDILCRLLVATVTQCVLMIQCHFIVWQHLSHFVAHIKAWNKCQTRRLQKCSTWQQPSCITPPVMGWECNLELNHNNLTIICQNSCSVVQSCDANLVQIVTTDLNQFAVSGMHGQWCLNLSLKLCIFIPKLVIVFEQHVAGPFLSCHC